MIDIPREKGNACFGRRSFSERWKAGGTGSSSPDPRFPLFLLPRGTGFCPPPQARILAADTGEEREPMKRNISMFVVSAAVWAIPYVATAQTAAETSAYEKARQFLKEPVACPIVNRRVSRADCYNAYDAEYQRAAKALEEDRKLSTSENRRPNASLEDEMSSAQQELDTPSEGNRGEVVRAQELVAAYEARKPRSP
jgi:hypothetical protein